MLGLQFAAHNKPLPCVNLDITLQQLGCWWLQSGIIMGLHISHPTDHLPLGVGAASNVSYQWQARQYTRLQAFSTRGQSLHCIRTLHPCKSVENEGGFMWHHSMHS